ncbi:MAG: G-D-S-L family lipolytic protein, partial [Chitinophagaceae bacterium]
MKYFLLMLTLSLAAFSRPVKKNKVIFFGDSITQAAVKPGGYIVKMDSLIRKDGLAESFELSGAGIGGNKVYDLYLRYEEDVLAKKPGVVVIWVGVNDVWHKAWGTGTDLDKFEKFYDKLIKKFLAKKIKVILATPAVIGEKHDGTNPFD